LNTTGEGEESSDSRRPPERLRERIAATKGFMPEHEGEALFRAALDHAGLGPIVEVGTYCGKSTLYLAEAARRCGTKVVTVDHHRGSEEHQPGWEYHDPELMDQVSGRFDTLGAFREAMTASGLEAHIVAVLGTSMDLARLWGVPAGLVFIDGGHSDEAARTDLREWSGHVAPGGVLAIHDVFPDPADGGRPPYDIYRKALVSGAFEEIAGEGSLRILRRRPAA
jgi:MMP 1-O-methyltransferase